MKHQKAAHRIARVVFVYLALTLASPAQAAVDDPFAGMEETFQRLPAHEALAAEILWLIGLKSDIRVYLDNHNPAFCGRSDANLRVILLSDWCSRDLLINGRYNWFVIEKVATEIGHILNGDGEREAAWIPKAEWQREGAQEFAGFIMRKLGASLDEARASLVARPSPGTFAVPAEPSSLAAIERGWRSGERSE